MHRSRTFTTATIVVGALALVVGLILGKGQGHAHSASNVASMVLLTVGFLAIVIGLIVLGVRSLRARRQA